MGSTNGETDQVLVEEKSSARIFTLNRPKQLNALNVEMVSHLLELFLACEKDPSVKLIILKGNGRAFCAGGDVAAAVRDITQGNWKSAAYFFRKEFTLNYVIATCSKPQVSILNGIVMGEEQVFLYMVDTALLLKIRAGTFPDIGEFVGLTSARLNGSEMLACGLATHFVPSERLPFLEEALIKADSSVPDGISFIIKEFSQIPNLKKNSAYHRLNIINKCFSRRTVEEIIAALEKEAAEKKDDWISSTLQSLKKASPTSLKISLRSIREGRLQGIDKCLVREFRMVCHVMLGEISKDFIEGCRAILLDKDKNPKWEPSKLESISDEMVEHYFSKVNDDDWEDLKLPFRSDIPAYAIAKL